MRFRHRDIVLLLLLLFALPARSQTNTYILNGSATQDNCNCYTLTRETANQGGSVWNASRLDLTQPFDFSFNVFLGCKDATGADGIVFILQTAATSLGTAGGGLGFLGVVPSVGISLDTWQNTEFNDPPEDHISIQTNGVITHGTDIAGPVSILANGGNVEDCQWHVFRISWDPATRFLRVYFDGSLRVEGAIDLVSTVFNNNQNVYWGFSASTGGSNNKQQFCTALNPGFTTDLTNNATCVGNSTVVFSNTSVSFATVADYYWNFGDGQSSTTASPAAHTYAAPGLYTAQLAITGLDGCKSDTLQRIIAVGDLPVAMFDIYDTCSGNLPRIVDRSALSVGNLSQWNWLLDGAPVSNVQIPQLNDLVAGMHTLQLDVSSNYGCHSAIAAQQSFFIKPTPSIEADATGSCIQVPVVFASRQKDNATMIDEWSWDFGDDISTLHASQLQAVSHVYARAGNYSAVVHAVADNGCISNVVTIPLNIVKAVANAGSDTVILKDEPYQLHATGGSTYSWSPTKGMDKADIADPVIILQDDQQYRLKVTTAEGCIGDDEINITVFKGSDIYVPDAFTPNNNNLNETLSPYCIGIKKLYYFTIYNRWGQLIFSSDNASRGWDGTINGNPQATGVYVWKLRAVDYVGKIYEMHGVSTLIR